LISRRSIVEGPSLRTEIERSYADNGWFCINLDAPIGEADEMRKTARRCAGPSMSVRPGFIEGPSTTVHITGHRLHLVEEVSKERAAPFQTVAAEWPLTSVVDPYVGSALLVGTEHWHVCAKAYTFPRVVFAATLDVHNVAWLGRGGGDVRKQLFSCQEATLVRD
jgi:hypothetical protein